MPEQTAVAYHEIPKADQVVPRICRNQQHPYAKALTALLNVYHRTPKKSPSTLRRRVRTLEEVLGVLQKLSFLRNEVFGLALSQFHNHLAVRYSYLAKLQSYLNVKQEKTKALLNVYNDQAKFADRVTKKEGGGLYAALHKDRAIERIDPLHRTGLSKSYTNWLARQPKTKDKTEKPTWHLVKFFLELESNPTAWNKKAAKYHTPMQARFNELLYEHGKARTWFALKKSKYVKYDWEQDRALEDYVPYLKDFHTLPTRKVGNRTEHYPENVIGRAKYDDPDRCYSYIYVMRHDKIRAYPQSAGFHSSGVQGKRVQCAGMIVAMDGKIVAVNNKSGHYRPNYNLLFQVVGNIMAGGAFHDDALVGVTYGVEEVGKELFDCLFFRVKDFVHLAAAGFPAKYTKAAIKKLYKKGPDGLPNPTGFPIYTAFRAFWNRSQGYGETMTWEDAAKDFLEHWKS